MFQDAHFDPEILSPYSSLDSKVRWIYTFSGGIKNFVRWLSVAPTARARC